MNNELRSRKDPPTTAALDFGLSTDYDSTAKRNAKMEYTCDSVASPLAVTEDSEALHLKPENKSYRLNLKTGNLEERSRECDEGVWMSDSDEESDDVHGSDVDDSESDVWNEDSPSSEL
eukprot:Lankesteria_metandrocarpae@DN3782_c0_g1_i1.p3